MTLQRLGNYSLATALLFVIGGGPGWAADAPSGISNFQEVNEHLYRGAQPSDQGLASLAKLGVKTIVDLRGSGGRSSHEAEVVRRLGMRYLNIPLNGFTAPTLDQVSRIMNIFDDPTAGPVFVHCRRGADRTGTVIAIYRISRDHWDNQKALNEAKSLKMARSERRMQNFVLHYQPATQSDKIKPVTQG